MNPKAAQWLLSRDTGTSSMTILARLEGGPDVKIGNGNYPLDPDDLGRCIHLLVLIPEYRMRLSEMADVNPAGRAPECDLLMQELIKYGEAEAEA